MTSVTSLSRGPDSLNILEERFVEEILIDPTNQGKAAVRAGYSPNSSHQCASRLLNRPKIQKAIAEGRQERAERLGYTQDRVLVELAKLAFCTIETSITLDSEGNPVAGPLTEVSYETSTDKLGNKTKVIKIRSPKLADKSAALHLLGKHLGIFDEKLEVSHTGSLIDLIEASYRDKVA